MATNNSSSKGAAAVDSTSVHLELNASTKQQRQPKRLVYFSDGVLEEYSTDESGNESDGATTDAADAVRPMRAAALSGGSPRRRQTTSASSAVVQQLDPGRLSWLPWFWYQGCRFGRGMLRTADFCGERVAWFLGITTPKYGYIIREYHRIKEEEEKEIAEREAELEARRRYDAERQQQQQEQAQEQVSVAAVAAQVPMANLSG